MTIKNTPFSNKHIALGAKMAPFAGYNMPISYTGINDEHAAVRRNAGVFDVSHMGEFILKGDKALDLIQRVTSNDASKLKAGQAQYSCLPNETGGLVDDFVDPLFHRKGVGGEDQRVALGQRHGCQSHNRLARATGQWSEVNQLYTVIR